MAEEDDHDSLPTGEEVDQLIAEGQAELDRGECLDGEEVIEAILARNGEHSR